MTGSTLLTVVILSLCSIVSGIDVPPGLRPAKAFGEAPRVIVPISSLTSIDEKNNNNKASLVAAAKKAPVIFQKNNRKNRKLQTAVQQKPNHVAVASSTPHHKIPRFPISPPKGKNYGVNTLLQTNLVDSKGRIMKGVNSVPIRVPVLGELRNAKMSRASASQVENEAEKIVPIQFGRAERIKRFLQNVKN